MEAISITHPKNISIETVTQHLIDLFSESVSKFQDLISQGNISKAIDRVSNTCQMMQDLIWEVVLKWLLSDATFLNRLRTLGGQKGLRLVSYLSVTITLPTGRPLELKSPFFVKAKPRRGRKKRGPQNRGTHLALELLGFVNKVSQDVAYRAVQLALLAPSFEIAAEILKSDGVQMSANRIRRLVKALAPSGLSKRVELLLDGDKESLKGRRVLLEVDGGRIRQRKTKKGRIPEGNKRNGFHSDWIEPKLFLIHVLDEAGKPVKEIPPIVDGTTGKLPMFLELLNEYLTRLRIEEADEVIVIGDGAPWIWERIPKLLEQAGVYKSRITQILDWTHAKQNLLQAFDKLPKQKRAKVKIDIQYFKDLLYNGSIDKIVSRVREIFKVNSRSRIMKKLKSYFITNSSRMQYVMK